MVHKSYRVKVLGGDFKGRLLRYPNRTDVRPTMQRTKASVFESLGSEIHHCVFVDLFAGAGSVGIEALSRGADRVHFVERNRSVLSFLRRNLQDLRVPSERYDVHPVDVFEFVRRGRLRSIRPDVVYVDPPYARRDIPLLLESSAEIDYDKSILFILEHDEHVSVQPGGRFSTVKTKKIGQTVVTVLATVGGGRS